MLRKLLLFSLSLGALAVVLAILQRRGAPSAGEPSDVAPPAGGDPRCAGRTRSGDRCSRPAEPDSRFCWQHRP